MLSCRIKVDDKTFGIIERYNSKIVGIDVAVH